MKRTEINKTLYSRTDQAQFVEDSLNGIKWVNPTGFPGNLIYQYQDIKRKANPKYSISTIK